MINGPDLDRHYFAVKRIVLGGLLALLAVQLAFYATVPDLRASLLQPWVAAKVGLFVALIAATAAARGRRANALLLGILVARYVREGLT